MARANSSFYTVGGTVQAGSGLYIPRRADEELLELCRENAFAYVLAPRQLGKSSLMVRTAERLQEEGILSVIVDLTQLGVQVSAEEWYLGLLTIIEDYLMLSTDVVSWWQQRSHLSNIQRVILFFQDLVLTKLEQPLVVFVDEIDTTLSLDFTDDFYAAIRSLYVARSRIDPLKRLSFVLIGVATPSDLIRDPKRTPFNIGQRVDMTDFSLEEALPLAQELAEHQHQQKQTLGWIFKWTGGHPYLTQRLCRMLAEETGGEQSPTLNEEKIDQVVTETFFGEKSFQDNNLQFVRDMLTRRSENLEEVLSTYRQVRQGKPKVLDEEQSLVKSHLKLSGVVKAEGPVLKVRNLIYRRVFDEKWIKEHLPINWAKRLRQAMGLVAASVAISVIMVVLAIYALVQQGEAQRQEGIANQRAIEAVAARNTAEARRQEAEKAQTEAERQNKISRAQALAANANAEQDTNPERSVLLGVEAVKLAQQPGIEPALPQASAALRQSLEQARLDHLPFKGHSGVVYSVGFSPDGQSIVSAGNDGSVLVWEVTTGQIKLKVKQDGSNPVNAAFSPDGQKIAIAYKEGNFKVLDALSGKELVSVQSQSKELTFVGFSPAGNLIVTTGSDGMVGLWEAGNGQLRLALSTTSSSGQVAANFSWDGRFLAVTTNEPKASIYEVQTGNIVATLNSDSGPLSSATFSPDGHYLVTAGSDPNAKVWEIQTGHQMATLVGHASSLNKAVFSPDGRYIATASNDRTAKIWEAQSGKLLYNLNGHVGEVLDIAYRPDGHFVTTASNDGTVRVWEALPGKDQATFTGHSELVNSAAMSKDGRKLVSAANDNTAIIWDVENHKALAILKGHTDWVTSASFSPDGKLVVTASRDNTAKIWDSTTGQLLTTLTGHLSTITAAAFSPDGRYIVTSSTDQTARVWETQSGKQLFLFKGHNDDLTSAAFSPDGRFVVTTSLDGTAKIWEALTGKELVSLKGHKGGLNSAAFSPDGRYIATAGRDTTVRLWEISSGQEVKAFKDYTDWVNSVSFSANSRYLATASRDGKVKVWEVGSGQEVADLKGHTGAVSSATFSPDGNYIVTAGWDRTIQLHLFEPGEMLRVAQFRLSRQLTAEERVQFGLETPPTPTPAPVSPASTPTPGAIPASAGGNLLTPSTPGTAGSSSEGEKFDLIEAVKFDGKNGKKGGQLVISNPGSFPCGMQSYFACDPYHNMVNATLIGQTNNGKYYPYLLTEVPTVENGDVRVAADGSTMEVVLKLKPGLKWSDGSPLTSKDLAFTVKWVNDPIFRENDAEIVEWNFVTGVDTPDDTTAILKYKQAVGSYLSMLSVFWPLPEKIWSKIPTKDADKSPEVLKPSVTIGPFKVDEFVENSRVVLSRNEYFSPVWGFNAYLDKVILRYYPDNKSAVEALNQGELDIIESPSLLQEDVSPVANAHYGVEEEFGWVIMPFNLSNPLFQEKAVRLALNLGLDRQALIEKFGTSRTIPLALGLAYLSPYAARNLFPHQYDPEGAKKLLEEAGWKTGPDGIREKNGQKLAFSLATTDGPPRRVALAQEVVSYWKALGANVELKLYKSGEFFGPWNSNGVLSHGRFDVGLFQVLGGLDYNAGYPTYHSKAIPTDLNKGTGQNFGRISDAALDKALDEQETTVDQTRRKQIWQNIQQLLYDNAYDVPLYNRTDSYGVSNRVKNFKPNPTWEGAFWNSVEVYLD